MVRCIGFYGIITGTAIASFISVIIILYKFIKKIKLEVKISKVTILLVKNIIISIITTAMVYGSKRVVRIDNNLLSIILFGTMSNMVECRSRGAYLLGLTTYGKYEIEETVDFAVYVPRIDEYFAGSLAVVPLQLLGYYVSVAKGLDVDKPRNLAKSVTVE